MHSIEWLPIKNNALVTMAILDGYLAEISSFLKTKNDEALKAYLRVEPPLPDEFTKLSLELKTSWRNSGRLERYVEKLVPLSDDGKADEGGSWPGFLSFIKEYLEYWRDVNMEDLARTHAQLSNLAKYVSPPRRKINILTSLAHALPQCQMRRKA